MSAAAGLPYVFTRPLVTERLVLRLLTSDDVADVYAYQRREDVCRYLPFGPRSRQEVADKIQQHGRAVTLAVDGDYLYLALELRGSEGSRAPVIGDSYFALSSVEHACGEIGWTMHPDYTGQGYAHEAAARMLELAFTTLQLHRVCAKLDVRNAASVALCGRLGMREEAHFVRDMMFKGEWSDTGVHAILAEEWRSRRTSPRDGSGQSERRLGLQGSTKPGPFQHR
jgi:RimJ/RimL family protein N-acetyltransferase